MKKRYLVLEDGTVFEGYAFGADTVSVGELIFNTNVVGYIETLTDPTNYGQIVLQTFPAVGNYGIIESDFIGEPALRGYVVREWCDAPSNFRCEYDINRFLTEKSIPGIYGVDTREITNILRNKGTMNAAICDEVPESLDEIKNYKITGAVANTGAKQVSVFVPKEGFQKHIALVDFGSSKDLELKLMDKGYKVTVLPYDFQAEQVLSLGADGLILSEGPGDPKENTAAIAQIAKLMGKIPMLGLGLGHQLMALAMGADTEKLLCGHHGSNQPCKVAGTGRTLVTAQNHGYAVKRDSLSRGAISHYNINDGSVEGIIYPEDCARSFQFELSENEIENELNKLTEEFNHAAE